MIPVFQKFLALRKNNEINLSIVSSTIKCMINVPAQCTDDFERNETLAALLEYVSIALDKPVDDLYGNFPFSCLNSF